MDRVMRRTYGYRGWAVMVLLLLGSGGCSTLSDQLPVPEPMVSLPSFEGAGSLDLAPSGLPLGADESSSQGQGPVNEARQDERAPAPGVDQPEPADKAEANLGERSSAESVSSAPSAQSESGGGPSEPDPAPQAPLLLSQAGYQKDLQAEKEAEAEPYDPFAKSEGMAEPIEEYDPWEPFNQAMFTFNRKLDEYVVKPVATVYDKVVPDPLEFGIRNVFHNVRFAPRFFNNLAQGKLKGAGVELASFVINSTFGLGGLFEFAKEVFGLETPDEDTGQTLGVYGTKPGPYIVVPFLGSFTARDLTGFVGDLALDPFNWLVLPVIKLDGAPKLVTKEDTILFAQLGMRAGYIVNERSINIETTFEGVEEATLDLYGAVRNAYLQKRAKAIRQ